MAAQSTPARGGWRSTIWGELSAEFLGTFVLIAFGCGVVAVAVAGLPGSGRTANPTTIFQGTGDWLLITWGWALAVAFGVYVAGGISGAHINPAVTLALAVKRDFPWSKVLPYWGAQLVGAFLGAALVFLVYFQAIGAFEQAAGITRGTPASIPTFSIFATFPAPYYNGYLGPFIDQVVGTMFLVLFVFALIDTMNQAPRANLAPLLVGLAVAAIGMSYGPNAGYAINPARDLGPRLWAWVSGWGDVAIPGVAPDAGVGAYFWVPIIGPLIGAVIGAFVYDFFIADVLKARGAQPAEEVEVEGEPVGEAVAERPGADTEREAEPRGRTVREE
jgi:glycerol uptake facilitator protein